MLIIAVQLFLTVLQVITGSHDCTIRLWDLAAGKSKVTLTNHKKSVRSVVLHPTQLVTLHSVHSIYPSILVSVKSLSIVNIIIIF